MFGFLSDTEIKEILRKDLFIHPLLDETLQIQGCKVDLHLGNIFYEVKHSSLEIYDPLKGPPKDYIREIVLLPGQGYILHPGNLVLCPTFENISIPHYLLGILQGRSNLARIGIIVHATAGFIDPGYKGVIVLELSNLGHLPIKLSPLLNVATIAFAMISGKVEFPYGSKLPESILHKRRKSHRFGKLDDITFSPTKMHNDWESETLAEN